MDSSPFLRERANTIFSKLEERDLPRDMYERICGWLLSDDSAGEKDNLLRRLFNETFAQKAKRPGKRDREMYLEFAEMNGIEVAGKGSIGSYISVAYKIAAVLVSTMLVTAATVLLLKDTGGVDEMYVVSVSASDGDVKEITLPDGSTVRLTSPGTLEYPVEFNNNRNVRLIGDARFSVKKNPGSPFTVTTDKITVSVLGTEFSVDAAPGSTEATVSLFSGNVSVGYGEDKKTVKQLAPLEKLTYDSSTDVCEVDVFDPSVENKAYRRKLTLDGENLNDALVKICEFKGGVCTIDLGFVSENAVRAIFYEDESLDQMLWMIQQTTGVFDYTIDGNDVFISTREAI